MCFSIYSAGIWRRNLFEAAFDVGFDGFVYLPFSHCTVGKGIEAAKSRGTRSEALRGLGARTISGVERSPV